ncbi:ATPase, T2SS/T4P/T4SS family [Streptomyces sp. NPDC050738]|uniref:CpaF family protein n=1 Tax=Streptomyces sp. NPDC050738 TaxID=3154744 RepID=UPI0034244998
MSSAVANGTVASAVDLVRQRVAARLAEHTDERERAGLPVQDEASRRKLVGRLLEEELATQTRAQLQAGGRGLDEASEQHLAQEVMDTLFGAGGLERLLADKRIENISINGAENVWLKDADGTKRRGEPVAASDSELVELIRTLAARSGEEERRFDRGVPRLNLELPDGSRMLAVMSVAHRVSVSIRRHRFPQISLDDLVRLGVCTKEQAAVFEAMVRARFNIVTSGGTGIGKTTFTRGLCAAIPPEDRLVTIEDTFELGLHKNRTAHPDVVAMQAREPNIEGEGAIDQAELVRWALRMSPDRVIVGEIRGSEVVPMCNAMSQGNDGSLSTIHSSSSRGVFTKLASYSAQSPERLSMEATNLMVASAVHFVIHLGKDSEGKRVVASVREVVDADGTQVISNEIYRPGPSGQAVAATPLRTETLDKLIEAGLDPQAVRSQWWGTA